MPGHSRATGATGHGTSGEPGRPAIDVFVPNRGYAAYLPACLDSLLGQEGVDVRVLVVDNASEDDSVDVVRRYAERDPRVQLTVHERDLGLLTSLSEGLAWCRADYCMNLSADDVLLPGALLRATRLLEARPDVSLVYGPATPWTGGRVPRAPKLPTGVRVWPGQDWIERCARTGHNPLYSPEGVMRTRTAQEVGFRHELPRTPDLGMWLQLAARGPVAHLRGVRQALYRLHPASMMQKQGHAVGLQAFRDAFAVLVERDRPLLRNPDRLVADAARAIALEAVHTVELYRDRHRAEAVDADALLELARRAWPDVVHSRKWTAASAAAGRGAFSPVRVGHLIGHKAHDGVRARVWRELGG